MRKKFMKYILTVSLFIVLTIQLSCKNVDTIDNDQVRIEETKTKKMIPTADKTISKETHKDLVAEVIVEEPIQKDEFVTNQSEEVAETISEEVVEVTELSANEDVSEPVYTDEKGIVSYVEGKVKKKSVEETDWKTNVSEKAKVKSRESYRTMKKSRAELELSGMDILRLAPKTTIDLVALYEEAKNGKQKTDIKLEEGDLWAQVNSADDESEFMMDTDIAAAAITGDRSMPKNGYKTPAATGTPIAL